MAARTLIHFVFTPKRRVPVFRDARLAYFAERYFQDSARRKGIVIAALAIQDDHVHCLAYLPSKVSVAAAAQHLKWWTSYNLRQRHRIPQVTEKAFWGHRYWSVSVGGGEATQRKYIEDQKREFGGDWTT